MKIKLINYNKTISHIGMNRVLIDEVKVLKPEETEGPEILEVLFVNETGTIKREFNLKEDIEYIVSLVNACAIEITDDFELDPDLLLGKVLYVGLATDKESKAHVYGFTKLSEESTADKKRLDAILSHNPTASKTVSDEIHSDNPFEDDDLPF